MKQPGLIFRMEGIGLSSRVNVLVGSLESEGWSLVCQEEGKKNYAIWSKRFKHGGQIPDLHGRIQETGNLMGQRVSQVEIYAYDPRLQEFLKQYKD